MPDQRVTEPEGQTEQEQRARAEPAHRSPAAMRLTAIERRWLRPSSGHARRSSSLEDVQVSYGPKPAVRGVSFDIGKNEITALIGPSGCGKSTLIRCLNRMNDLIPGARVEGKVHLPRPGPLRARSRRRRGAQAHRHGVPEAQPVPQVDLRQHRLRPARARHEGQHGRDRRARAEAGRALGRGQGPPQDQRLRHVRRPAAAPLHRPLPGGRRPT